MADQGPTDGRGDADAREEFAKRTRAARALANVVPTTKHAATLMDLVVARFGDGAVVQTQGKCRQLFVRAARSGAAGAPEAGGLLYPWPLLTFSITDPPPGGPPDDEEDRVIQLEAPVPGQPIEIPLVFHAMAATLAIHDGESSMAVNYRWSGRWKDTSSPADPDAFAGLLPVLERATDSPLELLAEYVASIDLGRHGPGRAFLPRMRPGGVAGAWMVALRAIREAIASRRAPDGSFWAAADGHCGTAIAFGASRDEALSAWRKEVERLRPQPPAPPPEAADETSGAPNEMPVDEAPGDRSHWGKPEWSADQPEDPPQVMKIVFRGWDAPALDPSPAATPGGVVRVAALPAAKPVRGEWTRWLGERGTTHFAVRLRSADGFTLVGEPLLSRFDLAGLDATLDALDEENPRLVTPRASRMAGMPEPTHTVVFYRCNDFATKAPMPPRAEQSQFGAGLHVAGFDASILRSSIVRQRQIARRDDD